MSSSTNGHVETNHSDARGDVSSLDSGRPDSSRSDAARHDVGRIEVITGPMFSGKSEELIRRLKRARIARQRVACFKPDIDLRYHRTAIASHSAQTHDALTVANVAELRRALYQQLTEVEVIGIDEAQFLEPSIVQLAGELVHLGKRVLIAGLDTTFIGEPFGAIPALMAISDDVTKLSAICMVCGQPAIHTQRLGKSRELVVVGAAGVYEARCRACFRPYLDAPEAEQMELPQGSEQTGDHASAVAG
jgi:thymidine kinase